MGNYRMEKVHSHFGKWMELTDEEKIRMGLKAAPKLPGTIKVVIPKRYNNHSVMYASEWIDEKTLERYENTYSSIQIVKVKGMLKRDLKEREG